MPFASAVTLAVPAFALPLIATDAPAVIDAGVSVPEMVHVCAGAVVDCPTFARRFRSR